MATYVASNNGSTTLAVAITKTDYTLTVYTGQGSRLPTVNDGGVGSEYTLLTLQKADGTKEIVCVVRHDAGSDTLTIGVKGTTTGSASGRNQEGGADSYAFAIGDIVACRPTAALVAAGANAQALSQPLDADLTAIAALTSAADRVPYATGAGTWALATLTTFGRALIAAADQAATRVVLALTPGVDVQAYDADTLKGDTTHTLTAGYSATPYDAGTQSTGTFTPDEANGCMQHYINGGAHTLAPPTNNTTIVIQVTNNGSAGTITTSGFTKVTGVTPTTTNGDDFIAYVTKINGFSHLSWQALQ